MKFVHAVFIGILAVLGAGAVLVHLSRPDGVAPSAYQQQVSEWTKRFRSDGVSKTYTEFLKEGSTLPYLQAHTLSHIMGVLLYQNEGLAGIARCTDDFGFGCYHGFAGKLIEEKGTAGVTEFASACKTLQEETVCEHGIGHGLLAYLGDDKLVDSLELCPPALPERTDGCYNGVFMEYELNTLRRDEGQKTRPLNTASPEEPCTDIPARFQTACYYELPAWWRVWESYGNDSYADQFEVVGKRCGEVANITLREACYEGAGAQIGSLSDYDEARADAWCALMPDEGKRPCLTEALKTLVSGHVPAENISI